MTDPGQSPQGAERFKACGALFLLQSSSSSPLSPAPCRPTEAVLPPLPQAPFMQAVLSLPWRAFSMRAPTTASGSFASRTSTRPGTFRAQANTSSAPRKARPCIGRARSLATRQTRSISGGLDRLIAQGRVYGCACSRKEVAFGPPSLVFPPASIPAHAAWERTVAPCAPCVF